MSQMVEEDAAHWPTLLAEILHHGNVPWHRSLRLLNHVELRVAYRHHLHESRRPKPFANVLSLSVAARCAKTLDQITLLGQNFS